MKGGAVYPEPLLSANIYCSGRLDGVIGRAVAPFRRELAEDPASYLWMIRHSRGGEHLKVRWHGPPALRERARDLLEERVRELFTAFAEAAPAEPDAAHASHPAIDLEDAVQTPYPDRSLLWTDYRASPVTFGAPVLAEDPELRRRFTRVLGAGAALVVDLFEQAAASGEEVPAGRRQSLVFKLCLLAWQALPVDAGVRARYLAYHRDWLVRWMLAHADPATTSRETILALFDRKAAAQGKTVDVLASLMAVGAGDGWASEDGPHGAYRRAVQELFEHVDGFRGVPAYRLDPYTEDPTFLPLFKVLHNLANALGLGIRNEALTYHLLTVAAGVEGEWE